MIDFYLVDVKSISSDVPRSNFSESDLEKLADMILESGGTIKPVILKQIGVEEFSVVDGHLEYYAAVKAREKNPRQGEMVNAFVISPKVENIVLKQIELLKAIENPEQSLKPLVKDSTSPSLPNNKLSSLEKQVSEISVAMQNLCDVIGNLKSQKSIKQITILEAFNTLTPRDLTFRLKTVNITGDKALQIVQKIEKERKNPFTSLTDVTERVTIKSKTKNAVKEVRGISKDKMLQIVDTWSQLSFD
jgi:predicted nucleic acid-binding OB-fold protein